MYLISLKSFCTGRATLKERKRQPSEWENKLLQLKLETRHSSPKTQSAHTVKVKLTQLCPTLYDPMDYTVQGFLYTRILEWVAFLFSRGSSQPRNQTQVSCIASRFLTSWATRETQEYWSG